MKIKRQSIPGLSSKLVYNATLTPMQVREIGQPYDPRMRYTVPIHLSSYKGKTLLVGFCGGSHGGEDGSIHFTILGSITMDVLKEFTDFRDTLVIHFVQCHEGVEQRVKAILDSAPDMSTIAIIGDMIKSCDGKVMPLFGLTGETVSLKRSAV